MPDTLAKKAWAKITLAECCEEIAQRIDNPAESGFDRFVGLEHLETGETSIRSWGSTEDVTSSMKLFKADDVIVARRNVYLRRAARAGFDGVCSGDGIVLRGNPKVCLPELLPFLLNTDCFWSYVTSQADGTMSKRITVKRLMAYEFALPAPEEQRRIAEVLQASETHREAILQSLGCARNVRKSLADKLFSLNGGAMHQKKIGDLVLDSAYGPRFPSEKYTSEGNAWTVRTTDFEGHSGIDLTTVPSALLADDVVAEHRLQNGDFLLSRSGEYAGMVRVFDGSAAPDRAFIPAAFLIRFRLDTNQILPEYLFEYCDSPIGRRQLSSIARGSAQPNISGSGFMNLKIDVPALAAQSKLFARIRAARQAESRLEVRTSAARTTAKAIANSVFGP